LDSEDRVNSSRSIPDCVGGIELDNGSDCGVSSSTNGAKEEASVEVDSICEDDELCEGAMSSLDIGRWGGGVTTGSEDGPMRAGEKTTSALEWNETRAKRQGNLTNETKRKKSINQSIE
jgi:hypothetical protein